MYRYKRYLDNIGIADILDISVLPIIPMNVISNAKQVGAALAARRKTLKLSQTDVANRLGLSQNRLSELESRPETLTVEQLLAIVNLLGLEVTLGERAAGKSKVDW